jgi:hypothetical protein
MRIAGIDPGSKGAIAFIDTASGECGAWSLPVKQRLKSTRATTELDVNRFTEIIKTEIGPLDEVWIEDVHSMPTDGHVGAFTFGMNKGALVACVELLGYKVDDETLKYVHASVWKSTLNVTADKAATKKVARLLFRECKQATSNEGKCEALLITLYGVLQHGSPAWPLTDVSS